MLLLCLCRDIGIVVRLLLFSGVFYKKEWQTARRETERGRGNLSDLVRVMGDDFGVIVEIGRSCAGWQNVRIIDRKSPPLYHPPPPSYKLRSCFRFGLTNEFTNQLCRPKNTTQPKVVSKKKYYYVKAEKKLNLWPQKKLHKKTSKIKAHWQNWVWYGMVEPRRLR